MATNRTLLSGHGGSTVIDLDVRFKTTTEICALFEPLCYSNKVCKTLLRTMKNSQPQLTEELAIRLNKSNPNHHLWNNNGTWWMHYTVYPTPFTSERRRKSLSTNCLEQARQKRDQLLKRLAGNVWQVAA